MRSVARAFVSTIVPASALALALTTAAPVARAQVPDPALLAVSSPPPLLAQNPPNALAPAPAPGDDETPATASRSHRHHVADPSEGGEPGDKGPEFKEWLRLNAGPLMIEPVVLMQVQGMPYVGADSSLEAGDAADRAGFRFRRARFGFEGRIFHRVPFEITAEFNSDIAGRALLHDAWFGYDRFKFLEIFVGTHDVPFSRSALVGSGDQALIERPFAVRAMAPFHQLGVHVEGHLWSGALNYYAGVYNGLQKTDQFFTGYVENSAVLGNRFDGLSYAGRLTSEPLGPMGRTIDDIHHSKFRVSAGASAFYSDGGTRGILGLGGDLLIHFQGLHVLGELLANRSTPKAMPTQPTMQTATITSIAAVGEAGYMILKERLGLTARFEWLDPNTAVKDESDSWIVTGGVSYHILHEFLKAQIDYNHREELHGKSLKNDSVVVQAQLNL